MNYRKIIIGIALLAVGLPVGAQGTVNKKNPHATVKRERVLPLVTSKIKLLTRTYGDSIVLRWAPEDYVSWKYPSGIADRHTSLCLEAAVVRAVPRTLS